MIVDYINIKIIDKFENDRMMQVEQTQIGAPKLVYNGSDDKYQPIMATEFSFNLTVLDRTDGKFFHLYTGNEKRYYILVEDQDDNMLFEGYLLPDFYEEPYKNGVIFVSLVATDGIALLKGSYLPNIYYKKETSVIKLIAECLKITKLEKEIYFSPAIKSAATNYRWDAIVVDGREYLDGSIEVNAFTGIEVMPDRKSAYDILELILNNIACTLYAQGNIWYVEGINRKHQINQDLEIYNNQGEYQSSVIEIKNIVDVVFFATPNISIQSPWKRVEVAWNIEEDGELIPEYANEYDKDEFQDNYNTFWKKTGGISLSMLSESFNQDIDFLNNTVTYNSARRLHVGRIVNPFLDPSPGENTVDYVNHYVSIKDEKKKYLKKSDEYITREIEIEIDAIIGDFLPKRFTLPFSEEDDFFKSFIKIDFLINDVVFFTTRNINSAYLDQQFVTKAESDTLPDGSSSTVVFLRMRTTATLDREKIEALSDSFLNTANNGFFNIKIHAPISPNPNNAYCYGVLYQTLSVSVTALKDWKKNLERAIDFSTVKQIEIFHGDSIADLTNRQFRLKAYNSDSVGSVNITILSSYHDSAPFGFTPGYFYAISYQDYLSIQNANPVVMLVYSTVTGTYENLDDIYGVSQSYGTYWFLVEIQGVFYIRLSIPGFDWLYNIYGSNQYFQNGHTSFNSFVLSASNQQGAVVLENNEWRESWKRYGEAEDIRFGEAIGKIYHDVQPEALVNIEGTATSLIFPREIAQFQWRDVKKFISTRLEIDFSLGRTNLYMIESKHEIITDYVD